MVIEPLNKNVFIFRDKKETKHLGLEISEGALVKNHVGEVVSISDEVESVNVGDRVYIPSRRINDYTIGDCEVAVALDGDLFAKKKKSPATAIPINQYVLVLKCLGEDHKDEDGKVWLYNTKSDDTNWVEIISYSKECVLIGSSDVGKFAISPESNDKLHRIGHSDYWCIHESLIEFTTGA